MRDPLERIAVALERIADSFDPPDTKNISVRIPVEFKMDGRVVQQQVIRHTLRQAARGPSSLTGGSPAERDPRDQ